MIIRKEMSERWLAAGSSPVDWCEENYTVSNNIAEFTNTISNFLFIVIPAIVLCTRVWSSYTKFVSWAVVIQMMFLVVIGLSSMYFHATLSLLGQLLDEIAIIWAVLIAYAFFIPEKMRPKFYHGFRAYAISFVSALVLTAAWFISPAFNAFAMMTLSFPILYAQLQEITIFKRRGLLKLSMAAFAFLMAAISFWVADKALCGLWRTMKIPGFHNLWHILVAIAAYLNIMTFSYVKAVTESPNIKPSIRYVCGAVPYVFCKELQATT